MDETYNSEAAALRDQSDEPIKYSRREILERSRDLLSVGAAFLIVNALGIANPSEDNPATAELNGTVPPPVEGYSIEEIQALLDLSNKWMGSERDLILPTIEGTTEIDWQEVLESVEYWKLNLLDPDYPDRVVPAPAGLISTDLNIAFIKGIKSSPDQRIPRPIGLVKGPDLIDWRPIYETTEGTYFGITINGEDHPKAFNGITQLEAGIITPQGEEHLSHTLTTNYIGGNAISEGIKKLVNLDPQLAEGTKLVTTDGYISPNLLFLNAAKIGIIGEPYTDTPFSSTASWHNALTQNIIWGVDGGFFKGIPGPHAGLDVIVTEGNPEYNIEKLIEDRQKIIESGQELPVSILCYPYLLNLGRRNLFINGENYIWNQKEFFKMLKDLNIIVVASLGNKFFLLNTKNQGLNWDDPETVELFLDTHLAVTEGHINQLTFNLEVDPNGGLPDPNDKFIQDASFIAPGNFPAATFSTYHTLNPNIDDNSVSTLFSKFDHGIIKSEVYTGGSSFALVAVAGLLAADVMATEALTGERLSASELLRSFKNQMNVETFEVPNDSSTTVQMRTIQYQTVLGKLDEAIAKLHVEKTWMPQIKN